MPKNIPAQALYNACKDGDAAAVSRLLPAGGTTRNLSGQRFQLLNTKTTPLIVAAQGGHTEIVRMLLERASNTSVEYADAQGFTAPLVGALYHHPDILRLLADHGANVNLAATAAVGTALRLAVLNIHPDAQPRDADPDGARKLSTVRALLRLGAAPDPVDANGMTPLCAACDLAPAKVVVALISGGADIDFTSAIRSTYPGFTPLMHAVAVNNAGVAKLLLKRGADGTKHITKAVHGFDVGSTALDIARTRASCNPICAETLEVLRKRCCSTCGMTSPGLSATTAGGEQHLKRCGSCPARGSRARYCSKACQCADWVPRHRGECAEARRARQAAGTEI